MVRAARRVVVFGGALLLTACASVAPVAAPPVTPPPFTPAPVRPAPAEVTEAPTAPRTTAATTVPPTRIPVTSSMTVPQSTTEVPGTTTVPTTATPTTIVATSTVAPSPATLVTLAPQAARAVGASGAVSMTAVPADLIVPTGPDSLHDGTNPINGRRGGTHPLAGAPVCTVDPAAPDDCLTVTLDALGLAVTGGPPADRARRRAEAVEVVQLDAGLPATGVTDAALLRYLGIWPGSATAGADEVRPIGTSAQGRPLTALRYGSGSRVVLVVAQTHGDEEAGLRVWLRARQQGVSSGVTLWVVPMLNPDGLADDTRFLADGADPNRKAGAEPEQQAVIALATAVRPVLTIWYHQNYGWIGGSGASMAPADRYHALTGLGPLYLSGDCSHGFMWCPIDDALGSSSILVELPDVVTPNDVQVHARAMLTVAGEPAP